MGVLKTSPGNKPGNKIDFEKGKDPINIGLQPSFK
jgi:hypothetical protein